MYTWTVCFACLERARERQSEDGARATHACTHANRHTQEKEKDTWLNGEVGGRKRVLKEKNEK